VRAPRWVLGSATAAPVLLIGGWTLAAAVQEPAFDSTTGTISALAGLGATDRWLMTAALLGLGVSHVVTASGLRPAASAGRFVLALGGAATLLVAAFPLPVSGGSRAHTLAAGVAVAARSLWPAWAWRRGSGVPWAVRPLPSAVAAFVLSALVVWFAVALSTDTMVGLAERAAAGAQALWPLAVAVSAVSPGRRGAPHAPVAPPVPRGRGPSGSG
jgi:hypothetical membrane protein